MNYQVKLVERSVIRDIIEANHYSKNINGVKSTYCFGLYDGDALVGGMIYGELGMRGVWSKYATAKDQIIELRRLVLLPTLPKTSVGSDGRIHSSNIAGKFIAETLRWLKRNTGYKRVISYADTTQNHEGTIYKATNFKHIGMTKKTKSILWKGRIYHDRCRRKVYKGVRCRSAIEIEEALNKGEATWVEAKPKHIYIYEL